MSFTCPRTRRVLKRRVAVWTALAFTPALHAQTLPATAVPTNAPTAAPTAAPSATPSQAASRSVATLPAISVSADAPSATLLEQASTGTLLGLTPFDTPASIDVISNEQLRERGAVNVTDAITQAAGISAMRHPGNGGSSLSSRGFTDSNSVAQLYDGVRQFGGVGQTFIYDPWAVDRIEVLRGPASVLYGEGAIGGVVNVIPKKPTRGPIENEIQTTVGTHDTQRLGFGSGGALDDKWSYRLDISGNHSNSGISLGDSRDFAVTAALRLDVSPDLNFTLTQAYAWQEPTRYFGTPLINGDIDYSLRGKNYNVADSKIIYRDNRTELKAEWTPNPATRVRSRVYYIGSDRDYRDAENYTWQPASGLIQRSAYTDIRHDQQQVGTVTDASFDGHLFGLANKVAVGVELNHASLKHTNNSPYSGTSLVDPYDVDHGRFINVAGTTPRYRNTADQYALFAENRLMLTERWSVLGGLRYDHIDLKRRDLVAGQTAFDTTFNNVGWRIGTVYDVLPTLSVYGQYAEAADPIGSLLLLSPANKDFELSKGRQVEVGVKQTFWDNKGQWTLAAYHIRKNNLVTRDPNDPSLRIQVGEQSSRGLEATLGVELTPAWRVDLNAAVLRARYDDFSESVNGTAVSRAGNVPTDVPERVANAWVSWKFAPQWTASAGVRYVGRRFADAANTLEMAGYTTTNLALQWEPRRDLTLALRAFNVFDRQYAETAYYNQTQWLLGEGRRVELSANYRF
ncbi:Ferrichrome outer membrane transporter/phage receptor [Achromobacter deleyi]|uniref:Ferrichrome outer membrane transporter/phage receptor n=1 Tax=Achromobacter deleyi TaxID=1353891 RepID=A0A6S7AAJ9_9BURK|nr:TonB-dependent receptor [Achromobacter deleyi]CAB3720246.1 Ferrichrome outer membrane transporter/phage receptor [Achromobacter deleyi]CAB3891715.1 Ferrichrome outer membrane transporter/phage receptor [Achromobacter deleyi]CAB3916142.1 Ferrichrome outer membrane transporter/phage receptor [Achromobacter deleyi]